MILKEKSLRFLSQNLATLRHAPVEMALALSLGVISVLMHHDVISHHNYYLCLGPIFWMGSFLLNKWFPSGKLRILYWLSWLPAVGCWWCEPEAWIDSSGYPVTLIIGLLAVLMCGWIRDNRRFVENMLRYLWDSLSALFLTGTAYLLLLAIFFSVVYIFNIFDDIRAEFCTDTAILFFIVLQPLVFLTNNRNSAEAEPEGEPSKLLDRLLNWVLTPAVLAYTTLLYLYFAKIVVLWTLPRGGIAYLVFGFTIVAVIAKAGQTLLTKRHYDWFYRRFSLISLPALGMFWIGVACRWSDYGLTVNRIYLIVCGLIMTFCIAAFLFRKTAHYLYVILFAACALALFTYIPGFTPEQVERWSQQRRPTGAPSEEGAAAEQNESVYLERSCDGDGIDLKAYKRFYEINWWNGSSDHTPSANESGDTLTLRDGSDNILFQETLTDILAHQLAAIGYRVTDSIPADTLEHYGSRLLDYRHDKGRVLFNSMILMRDSTLRIDHTVVKYYLAK